MAHLFCSVEAVPLVNVVLRVDDPEDLHGSGRQGAGSLLLHQDGGVVQSKPRVPAHNSRGQSATRHLHADQGKTL